MSHRIPPAHADGVLGVQTGPAPNTGAAWVATAAGARRIAHAGQERFDRIKQSRAYPAAAVDACRIALDLPADARPSLVACVDTGQAAPLPPYVDTVPQLRVEHALCHAAAAYYCSPFDEAAILVVDGHRHEQGATPSSHSVWIGWNGRIEPVMCSASCGIGALYEAVTVAIGFGAHETGKTMGLAPYGDDAAAPDLGGRLDGLAVDYGARCDADGVRLFGLSPLAGATDDESLAARATLARAAQRECERAMLHLARAVREMTGMRRLCLAGEVSLNGRANDLVWRDAGFDAVFARAGRRRLRNVAGRGAVGVSRCAGRAVSARTGFSVRRTAVQRCGRGRRARRTARSRALPRHARHDRRTGRTHGGAAGRRAVRRAARRARRDGPARARQSLAVDEPRARGRARPDESAGEAA